mgnify:FL=1
MGKVRRLLGALLLLVCCPLMAQVNTDNVMVMGRYALSSEDYVLAIQRFNRVLASKPFMPEAYFFRGLAKFYLEDYHGADADCTHSIERSPYDPNGYVLRGLCRVHMSHFEDAARDYEQVISMAPLDKSAWHNLVLCRVEMKQWDRAVSALDSMMRTWPKEANFLCVRAQVAVEKTDTATPETYLKRALEVNRYEGRAWTFLSYISLNRGEWSQAEQQLDTAIIAEPRISGNYINRALARYHQQNLRGAMSDYDIALEIDPKNYLGHFNRGLLRMQVGDDNRAIEDFDYVLSVDAENDLALYNRTILYDNTGDYRSALKDINSILQRNPYFWEGYMLRASLKRKTGDVAGAERDEFKVMKEQIEVRSGARKARVATRKQSNKNINDYDKLVEADDNEPEKEYASQWRGKVQNRYVELKPLPAITEEILRDASPEQRLAFQSFNRGCVLLAENNHDDAIAAFSEAVKADVTMSEAYYNRGVAYIMKGEKKTGLADLSHAGELGLYGAYNLIKRFSK